MQTQSLTNKPALNSPPPQALPLLPSPWFVLGAELLQGATFALAWAAGTVHVKRISPPHLRSTVQSIFQVGFRGLQVKGSRHQQQ